MDLTSVFNNSKEFILGVSMTAVVWPVIKFLWDKFNAQKAIEDGVEKVCNNAGLKVYNSVIKHIPDQEAKEKLTNALDSAGNKGDAGWDKGIRGEKI